MVREWGKVLLEQTDHIPALVIVTGLLSWTARGTKWQWTGFSI